MSDIENNNLTKKRSITTNGIYAIAAKIFEMLVPIIVMPYILRTLGVSSYGKIAYIQSLVAYFTLFATMGLSNFALRECSIVRDNEDLFSKKVSQVFTLSLFTTSLSFLVFYIYVISVPDARADFLLYSIYSFMIIGAGLNLSWLYYSIERFDLSSIRDIIGKASYLVLCFLLIHNSNDYNLYALIIVFTTSFITFAFNHYGVWKGRCGAKPRILLDKDFLPNLKAVFFLGLMTLGSKLFSSSDVILTKWLVKGDGNVSAGLYNTGIMLPLVIEQLTFTIASVITPRLYKFLGNGDEIQSQQLTNKISNAMYFVVVPAVVTFLFFPKELLFLLGGESYLPATNVLRFYSLILLTSVAITLAGTRTYVARRKEKKLFTILVSMAAINILLDFVLIKAIGITGAAIATLIANVLLMIVELSLESSWYLVFTSDKIKYLIGGLIVSVFFVLTRLFIEDKLIAMFVGILLAGAAYMIYMFCVKESTIEIAIQKIHPSKK